MRLRAVWIRFWLTAILIFPTLAAAQNWPEPPEVAGAFTAEQLGTAAGLEAGPSCHNGRDTAYCIDPDVQVYRQRLHESVAAALSRMPNTEERRDIAPSSISLFHGRLNDCRKHAVSACFYNPAGLGAEYPVLAGVPELAGDACASLAEKACTIARLTERIEEWNARNTEADATPVVVFHDPGFDCTRSMISIAFKTICGDANLSTLHRAMLAQIASLRQNPDARFLSNDQKKVLESLHRDSYDCRTDKDCISKAITQRVVDIALVSNSLAEAAQLAALEAPAAESAEAEKKRRKEEAESTRRVEDAVRGFEQGLENLLTGPSEDQIRDALQRHLDRQLAMLNPSAERCSTIRERNDTVDAILCLFAGGGELLGNTASITVHSVSIDQCMALDRGPTLCRYRAKGEMQGSGSRMGPVSKLFNAISSGSATFATFMQYGNKWDLLETYSSCTITVEQVSCI